jgi:hypothetical protein
VQYDRHGVIVAVANLDKVRVVADIDERSALFIPEVPIGLTCNTNQLGAMRALDFLKPAT